MTPLLVYLDSSDFSNLSNPAKKDLEDLKTAKKKLKEWIASGKIEIRYSLAHIMEAVPTNKSMSESGKLRLECIKELCGKKALKDPISIIINELSDLDNKDIKNDRGHWLPDIGKLWNMEPSNDEEPPKNRQQRREQRALTKKAIKNDDSLSKEVTQEYPIKKDLIFDVLSSTGKDDAFTKALRDSTADLDFLCRWYLENWEKSTQFSTAVREAGKDLKNLFTTSAEELKSLFEKLSDEKESESEIIRQLNSLAKALADKAPQDIVDALLDNPDQPKKKIDASFETTPSTYIFSKLIAQLFLSSVVSLKNTRKARDSDLGDLIHSLYIPHVDFFRADQATANSLKNIQTDYRATVATDLNDLIHKIESTLKNKP